MSPERRIVIVGAGMAANYAAETLRKEGFAGAITMLGAEAHRPYDRPPLSKEYLRGDRPVEKLFYHPDGYYQDQQIELRLGTRATALITADRVIALETGERIAYDQLLLCTGGEVRQLRVPGSDLPGVVYLRTLDDADRLRRSLRHGLRVVVIGAGFIGSEIAASARHLGCEVHIVELEQVPLLRVLGPEVGAIYADIHRDHGVRLSLGEGVAEFRGSDHVEAVVTSSGTIVPCDIAVVGVGIKPAVDWLETSGLELRNGIVVNEFCEASVPDVYAAGDLANWFHPRTGERLRVEHWDNAMHQGVAAAKSMVGKREPYAPVPYFWSDQYEFNLQYVGHAATWQAVVVRGDVPGRSFSAFYLQEGRLAAALVVNRFKDLRPSRRLIEAMTPVSATQLADEQIDLRSLSAHAT